MILPSLLAAMIMFFVGYLFGKSAEERRRERDTKGKWIADQAKLPRARREGKRIVLDEHEAKIIS